MTGYLADPAPSPAAQAIFDQDRADLGYVMNVSRLWAYEPAALTGLFDLLRTVVAPRGLSLRMRGVLVTACASALGDSYCSLAWGRKLAGEAGPELAAAVLSGDDRPLDTQEKALATWARKVATDPNRTDTGDVQALRDAGFDDDAIFGITVFVALRLAFSTVNDALGVLPDASLAGTVPESVRAAVTYGRPIATVPTAVGAAQDS